MICEPYGVDEKLQGIAKICLGCKQMNFSKEWGFTCGWGGWDNQTSEVKPQ